MNQPLDLKEIERRAFRSTYQDGLWDIYQGGIVLSFTAFAGALSRPDDFDSWQRFLIFVSGIALSYLVFWAGKKFITLPRLGQAVFGPVRQQRNRRLSTVLGGIVAIQSLVVLFSIAAWNIPTLRGWLGGSASSDMETLIVALVGAFFVGPSLTLIAFFNDFSRGYYIAAIMALAVFCLIWFDQAVFMLIAGSLIVIPGLVLFVRFLMTHPVPAAEDRHE